MGTYPADGEEPLSAHLVGRSHAFRQVIGFIRKVAPTQAPVLILGETGTTKEVVARAIHFGASSGRKPRRVRIDPPHRPAPPLPGTEPPSPI